MKVILFGATGMVGGGVLTECLEDARVSETLSVGRTTTGIAHPRLRELLRPSLDDLTPLSERLKGYDACFFCLGVTSVGRSEDEYRRITYDLTLSVARTLVALNPAMTFIYVSGAGTDTSERGRVGWARVKGATENALRALPFRAVFLFRPGVIRAMHGARTKTRAYRVAYAVLLPFILLAGAIAPNAITTTVNVGRAMLVAARDGAPDPYLGNREINTLAARW